ncbi:MAG: ATP-binding protein [Gammaproteobacteria bacterium]|nr:ATP-binding protein [Gammaproteobacteria bacterium]
MITPIIRQASSLILKRQQPEYHRFLYHTIDFSESLIGVKGARGAGKTTLLLQYAQKYHGVPTKVLYVSCDHPAMVDVDLYELAQIFYQEGGQLLLIDEIHKSKQFAVHLKAIKDTFDLQVIFSGSSALRIENELADLSRRAVIYELPVLSFREFLEIELNTSLKAFSLKKLLDEHINISSEIMQLCRPIEQFKRYLRFGAYPFYLESQETYDNKLLEVINTTIDSDLCGIYNIEPSKLDKLKKILYMLCTTNPVELNKSKLSGAVGASWPTLAKYLNRMDAGSLIHIVRGGKGMRVVNKPDKLLLDNSNLFYTLCASPNIGSIRESFFISQVSYCNQAHYHNKADFIINDSLIFEIGGKGKMTKQIVDLSPAWLAMDDIEIGDKQAIPLWLFGFLY